MRVLLVEDEPTISAYVRRGLEEQGYAVDTARTGREALAWAEGAPYDLIVLDILLPEVDGISVCRELRASGSTAAILMLTARDAVDDRVAGLDAGADDYMVKPFSMRELTARLRALSRRASGVPRSAVLHVADLSLDPLSRRASRAGVAVDLTAKEYAVLEFLMREAEHVVTRTQIAEHVWNYDVDNQSNVVDVHVKNLRRKIDDPWELKLIQTVRGAGYRLSATGHADVAS